MRDMKRSGGNKNGLTFLPLLCSSLDTPLFSNTQMAVLLNWLKKRGEFVQIWHECLPCKSHLLYLRYCFLSDSKAFKECPQIRCGCCCCQTTLPKTPRLSAQTHKLCMRNSHKSSQLQRSCRTTKTPLTRSNFAAELWWSRTPAFLRKLRTIGEGERSATHGGDKRER